MYNFSEILDYSETQKEGYIPCNVFYPTNCGSREIIYVKPIDKYKDVYRFQISKIMMKIDKENGRSKKFSGAYMADHMDYELIGFSKEGKIITGPTHYQKKISYGVDGI